MAVEGGQEELGAQRDELQSVAHLLESTGFNLYAASGALDDKKRSSGSTLSPGFAPKQREAIYERRSQLAATSRLVLSCFEVAPKPSKAEQLRGWLAGDQRAMDRLSNLGVWDSSSGLSHR